MWGLGIGLKSFKYYMLKTILERLTFCVTHLGDFS